jgi:ribosomal protein S1
MHRSMLIALALLGLVGVSSAVRAHDASLHKGKPTLGEVVSVEDNGLKLKTATGTTTVTFREETKFERGDKKATREELKPGDQVSVFGTKLPSGELVAREVLLPKKEANATQQPSPSPAQVNPEKQAAEKK